MTAAERIAAIYQSRTVEGRTGTHTLHSAIDPREGAFLAGIIGSDPNVAYTLEVGCAYGLSSLHICGAIQGRPWAFHQIIDPFQFTQWDGVGMQNLAEAGLERDRDFALIPERSEFALPQLLKQRGDASFDFIFIDGWHTFDHTMVDAFYATRLLRVGGYLVLDDVGLPSVRGVVDRLRRYPCYTQVGEVSTERPWSYRMKSRPWQARNVSMVALKKVAEDQRHWSGKDG